ncbi:MAG: sigma-54 dependent transcriptional regulator [Bacteroidetes bacterium]|nr:sigma-54 dependent transcriptional regulator [Bacteroidota bacterium]MCL5737268.1 sigma-54 dependent transcriptional regulator [Bacteroidota bacterium]
MRGESILIADDEKLIRWSLKQELIREGFDVLEAETVEQTLAFVREKEPDLIILDQRLPDGTGIDVLQEMRKEKNEVSVIMVTAVDRSDVAVQAMKLGASDYVTKPVNIEELKVVINKTLESTRLKRQVAHYLREQEKQYGFCGMIGSSPVMQKVFEQIQKVAKSSTTTVLITGESGTGKELVARAIYFLSDREGKPLMTVNCTALTETLIESELFGHEKGAFTDAKAQKKGIFELADGGTVFLDEIGDMTPALQAKLLRVLEQKTFRRVGGNSDITVDVRIIAATNQPLEAKIAEGKFRTDLYYRLNVANIHLPPLMERGDDVLLLANFFLQEFNTMFHKHFKGLSDETRDLFLQYHWPGNVRELRNVMERAVLLDDGDLIFAHHVKLGHLRNLPKAEEADKSEDAGVALSLYEIEKQTLIRALEKTNYNQSQAARLLKVGRDTLRYRMKKYGLLKKK